MGFCFRCFSTSRDHLYEGVEVEDLTGLYEHLKGL
jgi:hypothetical protein